VIITRSQILGFGKLKDRSFEFHSGLNMVFAANEGGKSTLQRFLVSMLYGQLRSDLKIQRRLDPWVDQYKPWHGSGYGGILWCRIADGREVEIHRSFGKDENHIEIRSASGEDITRQYEQQRNGEVLFARSHLGMPKELYESIGIIRENRVAEIQGYETIRDRIANLAQSGDEELSIRRSLAGIQGMLDSIGSERAPTKPYKQALDLVQSLQSELKALEERKLLFQSWIEERNRIADEIAGLERELSQAQFILLTARKKEMVCRIASLEDLDAEIIKFETEIESLDARADFPDEWLDALNQLVSSRDGLAGRLDEVRSEKESALAQLAQVESERRELEAYASFSASADAEKITEWFVSYLGLSLQKDGLHKTLARLSDDARSLQKRLDELVPALKDAEFDWQTFAREAAEEEQNSSQRNSELSERLAREQSRTETAAKDLLKWRMLAVLMLALAAVPFALQFLARFRTLNPAPAFGLSGLIFALAIFMMIRASKTKKELHGVQQNLIQLQNEQNSVREAGSKKRKKLNEIISNSGFEKLDDFLAAAKQSEQDRQKMVDLRLRLAETEQQRESLQSQTAEVYQSLKEGLAKAGLSCSPGNLKFQIDILRTNLRRFRELDAAYNNSLKNADALKFKEAALTEEYGQACSRLQSILDQANVSGPDKFRLECQKRRKLIELIERKSSRTREYQRLAGGFTLPQWKEQICQLEQQSLRLGEVQSFLPENSGTDAPLLPYLPSIAEAEEEERRISSHLSGGREEYARAVERTNNVFQNFRLASEIEEDLAAAQQEFEKLEKNRIALSLAFETLENLARQQQEVLAPQLNSGVEGRFLRLCDSRYEEVKIDPDFQVWVREADTGELRLAEHLSRGAQDQLYFSMRFGILDLVSNEAEPCPSLLDEPFAAYDRARLEEAFAILLDESKRRQLILFTCRNDLLELARREGIHLIRLAAC
jgi:predicted  nucleic acid-binding Zn-ribbon protein